MKKRFFEKSLRNNFFLARLRIVLFLVTCAAIALTLFSISLNQGKYRYDVGDVVKEDLIAVRSIEDTQKTEALREKAAAEVLPVEYVDPLTLIEVRKDLDKLFARIAEVLQEFPEDPDLAQVVLVESTFPGKITLSQAEAKALTDQELKTLEALRLDLSDLLSQSLVKGIDEEQLAEEKKILSETAASLKEYPEGLRIFAGKAASALVRANRFSDAELTREKVQLVRDSIEPVIVPKGTLLASAGTVLTESHIHLLRDAGMLVRDTRERNLQLFGAGILLSVLMLYLTAYFYTQPGTLREPRMIFLTGILMVLMMAMGYFSRDISPWVYPFAAFPMMMTLVADFKTATILNSFLCILLTAYYRLEPAMGMTFWFAGFTAALSVRKAEQRSALFMAGIVGSLVGAVMVLGLGFAAGEAVSSLLWNALYIVGAGALSSVLLLGSLPVWELVFKVLTPTKLLELSNPSHPLLKKLLMEAPGTYHHSILVGNLSESAAHAIGANALLARVAAFYHDIGKVPNPQYFTENQMGGHNPHDTLPPETSAVILRNHVANGLKLADEYHLPVEIRDVIEQHHGSSVMRYFYHKAQQERRDEEVAPGPYSYEGKPPRSKESAIIMLADSVEAAVRSLPEMTSDKVSATVKRILEEKQTSGQLSHCQLTFSELSVIAERFESILAGIYHERIQYPEPEAASTEAISYGNDL